MSQSFKYKNNMYLDSTGVAYNKATLKSKLDSIGKVYSVTASGKTVNQNTANYPISLTLPAGTYVVVGYFEYWGSDLRYYLTLYNTAMSAYDNAGYVAGNITDIAELTKQTTISLMIWPSKTVSVSAKLMAVRIR